MDDMIDHQTQVIATSCCFVEKPNRNRVVNEQNLVHNKIIDKVVKMTLSADRSIDICKQVEACLMRAALLSNYRERFSRAGARIIQHTLQFYQLGVFSPQFRQFILHILNQIPCLS